MELILTCSRCGETKDASSFGARKARTSGYTSHCKKCDAARKAAYRSANRDKVLASLRASYYKRVGRTPSTTAARTPRVTVGRNTPKPSAEAAARKAAYNRAYLKEWQRNNKDKKLAHIQAHRAAKRKALPAWADKKAMLQIYAEARSRTEAEGVAYQVDHIVPLQSRYVCGLHTPSNLRVILATENAAKKNLWWPDMP